ncbi:MAG: SpoIIE family protein phosphatase [Firmicutes bacterium]|nr:SpoIIE family protein phosphatase [Bacillota bacterium]
MELLFSKMIGTLAVIFVIAFFLGGSDYLPKFLNMGRNWKSTLIAGFVGGLFGIYGNLSGAAFQGAVISVRDIGPMMAGFFGGPFGGLLGGVIAGAHRYTMGGITATACIVATCLIGLICGLLSNLYHECLTRPGFAFCTGVIMEVLHLTTVLVMVKPFETALDLVEQIAMPFILVNALGFALLISLMSYVERQRTLLLEQNRLHSELEAAKVIQQSLLPPISESYPGRPEFSVRASMTPAKDVGGDFFDVFFVSSDRIAFLVADVSGKGIPAAMFMATAKMTLQNCVRDFEDLSEAIARANDSLCSRNEAEMFVTAWIGVLDIPTGRVDYVCAGHNPPLLLTPCGPEYLRTRGGFVLGGMESMPYRQSSLQLAPGDSIFLYTDGVTEAENTAHVLYGEDRLQTCLQDLYGADPQQVLDRVCKDMELHVKNAEQFDDITMLCLRRAAEERE